MSNKLRQNQVIIRHFENQIDPDSCGAACAVTVLDAIRVAHPPQRELFGLIQAFPTRDNGPNKENWASSPDGLTDALNQLSRANHFFKLHGSKRQSVISKWMVWTKIKFGTPCIALIKSGIHWVVVYDHDFLPGTITPTRFSEVQARNISTLNYFDPFTESQIVSDYSFWLNNVQIAEDSGLWKDKFLAICDPDPFRRKINKKTSMQIKRNLATPSKKDGSLKQPSIITVPGTGKKPVIQPPTMATPSKGKKPEIFKPKKAVSPGLPIGRIKTAGPDKGLIDISTAKSYSMWYLKNGGFYKPGKFIRMMKKPAPGMPVLVRHLDGNDFWYLVPFIESGNVVGGIMRIDAKKAKFQDASFFVKTKKSNPIKRFTTTQITGLLVKEYGSSKAVLENKVEPILVWKPCEQSYTSFSPFYKVKMGNKTVYMRMDGEIFDKLTKRK